MLTLIRLLLIPVVVLLAVKGQMTLGGITFILVCMTDLLDGYIARKYGMITKVGIWLDPVADKLMAISVIITFTAMGVVPLWVTITLFVKDGLLLLGGALALKNGNSTPSDLFGKISAFLLNTSIAAGFFRAYLGQSSLYIMYVALDVYKRQLSHRVFDAPCPPGQADAGSGELYAVPHACGRQLYKGKDCGLRCFWDG